MSKLKASVLKDKQYVKGQTALAFSFVIIQLNPANSALATITYNRVTVVIQVKKQPDRKKTAKF